VHARGLAPRVALRIGAVVSARGAGSAAYGDRVGACSLFEYRSYPFLATTSRIPRETMRAFARTRGLERLLVSTARCLAVHAGEARASRLAATSSAAAVNPITL